MTTIPLAAYRQAAADLSTPPRLPSLAHMVLMLKVPHVWERLDLHHRLIVQKAERVALDEGADPSTVVTLMKPLGAMIDAHYYAQPLPAVLVDLETPAPLVDHAAR